MNRDLFDSPELVGSYDPAGGLSPAERALIDGWDTSGAAVLDLGVGTGRTFPALSARAERYVGIDYAAAMVDAARANYPDGDFRVGDAADLSGFDDGEFDLVVFSYNGLDYLHPLTDRHTALWEIHRVLRPGGTLILSSHNSRAVVVSPRRHAPPGASPGVAPTGEPSRPGSPPGPPPDSSTGMLRRIAVTTIGSVRAVAHLVPTRTFWSGSGYLMDRHRPLLTHYTTPRLLRRELEEHGFTVTDMVGGDHPRRLNRLRSPWTYVSARRH